MNKLLLKNRLMLDIKSVLIVGQNNYFDDSVEVEMIAKDNVEGVQRYISVSDFEKDKKRPLYYKYHNVVVEEKYLFLFSKIKYYFEDTNFKLIIILDSNYQIEDDDLIISLLDNKSFESKLIERESNTFIEVTR